MCPISPRIIRLQFPSPQYLDFKEKYWLGFSIKPSANDKQGAKNQSQHNQEFGPNIPRLANHHGEIHFLCQVDIRAKNN